MRRWRWTIRGSDAARRRASISAGRERSGGPEKGRGGGGRVSDRAPAMRAVRMVDPESRPRSWRISRSLLARRRLKGVGVKSIV